MPAVSARLIRSRIKSVKNTRKITKAMELVAASKMRRAVSTALQSRTYATLSWELLLKLQGSADTVEHPLFVVRPVAKILMVVMASNRGLAGGFNSNVLRKAMEQVKNPYQLARNRVGDKWLEPENSNPQIDFVVVGKKAENGVHKISDRIIASFVEINDVPKFADVRPLIKLLVEEFKNKNYDKVVLVYTDYVSALVQKPKIRQLLPVSAVDLEKTLFAGEGPDVKVDVDEVLDFFTLYEPNIKTVVEQAATRLVETQVFQAALESAASEHSARMMSMHQATDAAGDMIDDLTLVFNQARQAGITREISEISAGKAALE